MPFFNHVNRVDGFIINIGLTFPVRSSSILRSFTKLISRSVGSTPPVIFFSTFSGTTWLQSDTTWERCFCAVNLSRRQLPILFEGFDWDTQRFTPPPTYFDCPHLKVCIVRSPLGGLLASVLVVPVVRLLINISQLEWKGPFLSANRVLEPDLDPRVFVHLSLECVQHTVLVLLGHPAVYCGRLSGCRGYCYRYWQQWHPPMWRVTNTPRWANRSTEKVIFKMSW